MMEVWFFWRRRGRKEVWVGSILEYSIVLRTIWLGLWGVFKLKLLVRGILYFRGVVLREYVYYV